MILFICMVLGSGFLVFFIGEGLLPYVDSGQMRLHVRAPEGTRIEETEQLFAQVEAGDSQYAAGDEIDLRSSTILDCRQAASAWCSVMRLPSAPRTATF